MKSFNQPSVNGTHLTLCCQVSSEETAAASFSIQWHHSSIYPLASNKTSDIKNTIIGQTAQTIIQQIENNTRLVWSKLTTHILEEKDIGFYWCSVKSNDSDTFIPSTVLNISLLEDIQLQTCNCGDRPIIDSTLFSEFPCATGNVSEVDTQSDNCQQGGNKEASLSTNVAKDLWTTVPPEIDIDNGSTTGQGTESLTTLPTELSSSTTQETTVEITTEKVYEDIIHSTNAADTEWPTTAGTSRRDQLDRIMISFTVGKLPHPLPQKNLLCMNVIVFYSNTGIVTGAILSLIILLCLIIGICLKKISKTRAKDHEQQTEHAITISTPVEVYNMTTKTKLVRKESVMSSSFTCEPNTSYDFTPGMIKPPSLEHVYDCIP